MKKILAMLLVLSMILGCSVALSEDTGIKVIGGPATETTPVTLDDMKVGQTAKIDGFGDVTILSVDLCDSIKSGYSGRNTRNYGTWYSGDEAAYLYLQIRILNTQKQAQDYNKMIHDIVCDFGDGYQFGGWYRQRQNDSDGYLYYDGSDSYEISPLYAGQYGIIVTLPNFVVESKEPLSVTFYIDENEFTYHHRR